MSRPSRKSTNSVFDSFRKLFKRVHRRRRRGGRDRKPLLIKILVGITIAVIAAIASAITIDRLSISRSKLVHAGGAPQTPVLDVKFDYDRYKVIFHVKTGLSSRTLA